MKQSFVGRHKDGILAELNVHQQTMGKKPIKRWRLSRQKLEDECQRLFQLTYRTTTQFHRNDPYPFQKVRR